MARVDLNDLHLHLADTPASFLRVPVDSEKEVTDLANTGTRVLVNGRVRAVLGTGITKKYQFASSLVDRTTYLQFTDLVASGRLFMVRDTRGRVVYGHIFGLDASEVQGGDYVNLSFTVETVTYSEEV